MGREPGHTKRAQRVDTARAGVVTNSAGKQIAVRIVNISSGGFRLECEQQMMIGEFVTLRVEGHGPFPCHIRWALGADAGGAFLQPATLPPVAADTAAR